MILHLGPSAKKVRHRSSSVEKGHINPYLQERKTYKKHPSSYIPISILSCLGQLLERIINTIQGPGGSQ